MVTILVTGANGQLGNELRVLALQSTQKQYKFIFTDMVADPQTIPLDITDATAVERIVKQEMVEVIVNCAAYTNVDRSQGEPQLAEKINCHGAAVLAQAAHKSDATLIHVSTDYVFDGTKRTPYLENDPTAPLGVYGATKLAGERVIAESGCRSVIIRTAWLYSSFGNNFVKTMIRLGRERDSINVVCDQRGTPTYAADLAQAIMTIAPCILETPEYAQIYHYTDTGEATWHEFATRIMALSGIACDVRPIAAADYPTPTARPTYSVLSKTKIGQRFDICPPQWEESLGKCISLMGQ